MQSIMPPLTIGHIMLQLYAKTERMMRATTEPETELKLMPEHELPNF
jgi:hypothetical protein